MAWYDTALTVANPMWGASKWAADQVAGGKTGDVVDTITGVGNFGDMGFDQSIANKYGKPAGVNQQAFDPMASSPEFAATYGNVQDMAQANQAAMNDPGMTRQFDIGAQPGGYQVQAPQQVSYNGVTPSLNRADAGIAAGNRNLSNVQDARVMQVGNLSPLQAMAAGQGPSVGREAMLEGAAQATGMYGSAAENANRAFGQQAAQAGAAYGDAAANQAFATQQAGQQAAQRYQDAAGQGIRQQAALAAGARGGNIGLALRGAQQGAAGLSQNANIQAGRAQEAANQAAGFQAAQAQRTAALGQQMAGLQTAGAQEQANIQALRANETAARAAAGLQNQEMIAAQGMLGEQLGQIRQQDIGAVGAATGVGNLGLGADTTAQNALLQNAQMNMQAQQYNQQAQIQQDQLAQQAYEQAAQRQLTAAQGNQTTAMQMAQAYGDLGQGYTGYGVDLTGQAAGLGAEGETLRVGDINQGLTRGVNAGLGVGTNQTQLLGAGTSAVGVLGAAALSDRRTKEGIKSSDAPDFRNVGSWKYRYKKEFQDDINPDGDHFGPMADELPSTVKRKGQDGYERVDTGRLALHNTSALGDAQRRLSSLEDIVSRLGA